MKSKEELGIVFMGTPDFAVTILEKLISEKYNIKAVVTIPDKPAGRGQKLHESAVKKCALSHQLPILQPESLRDEDFITALKESDADLFIVVAFRMLPKLVWEIPAMGTFNLHGSLLPEYRGAAPINWAVINGEKETGVTTFFIDEEIDTGHIIMADRMSIGENETAGEVHDRMMVLGAETVAKTVELIQKGEATPQPQQGKDLKAAPKIHKQDCLLNFDQPIESLHNFIRGMSPYPTAWLKLKHKEKQEEKTLKVFLSNIINQSKYAEIKLLEDNRQLILQTQFGQLSLLEIQLEGKKRLDVKSFLSGFKVDEWEIVV
ncbi:MAG TPA: methionyl-tRNA formyltransferase [Brumimicrobium sp.]|nr:methionyl-tRNA formyltransferase [Brumimicrobium sp.]